MPDQAEAIDAVEEEEAKASEPNGRRMWSWRAIIILGLIVLAIVMILRAWNVPPFKAAGEKTDNAYVRGQTTVISPQVSGYVTSVLVQDFQTVSAGQELIRIDDRTYRQKVDQASAQIASADAALANSRQSESSSLATVSSTQAGLGGATAQLRKAQADMRRASDLAAEGSISLRERDQTLAALRQAEAAVAQSQAQIHVAQEQVKTVTVGRGSLRAGVQGAQASREMAMIDLSNTVVRAPQAGTLSEVTVKLGQFVSAGSQLLFLVPEKHWIVANFKEAQVANIRIGQPATLRIDALGDQEIRGHVERISPAAGSEFSVIKPDNASGNFVKVPQRIPVRISVDPGQPLAARLRPGMSVIAVVDTSGGH